MKKGDWDAPESWHCIQCAGSIVMIDSAVRLEIERWLAHLEYPRDHFSTITIDSILGETITICADSINLIYDSTPMQRFRSRCFNSLMDIEALEQGFPDE